MSLELLRKHHLSEDRGARLRENVSRLNLQVSQAEDDVQREIALCQEMLEVMTSGPDGVRVVAAMEMPSMRESRDRALGKLDKLRRERDEVRLRLDHYNMLRRSL